MQTKRRNSSPLSTTSPPHEQRGSHEQQGSHEPRPGGGQVRDDTEYGDPTRARDVGASRVAVPDVEGSEDDVLQHLGHQGGDGRPLGPRQGHVREERVALELVDHGDDAVVASDAQVVALGDVVGQDHL